MRLPGGRRRRRNPLAGLCVILLGLLFLLISCPSWLLCALFGGALCCVGTAMLIIC